MVSLLSSHFQIDSNAELFITTDLFSRREKAVVERLSIRKVREVLRLIFEVDLSVRKITRSFSIEHASSRDQICQFAVSRLLWVIRKIGCGVESMFVSFSQYEASSGRYVTGHRRVSNRAGPYIRKSTGSPIREASSTVGSTSTTDFGLPRSN